LARWPDFKVPVGEEPVPSVEKKFLLKKEAGPEARRPIEAFI